MNSRARRGFGLIELMVALAISSLLLIGITQLFISSKDNYRLIEGISRLQENARFAIDSLSRDLRHSGLYGCRSGVAMWGDGQTPRFENAVDPTGAIFQTNFNNGNALQGYNATSQTLETWAPSNPVVDTAVTATDLVPGSDMIVIRGSLQAGERVETVDVPTNTITTVGDIDLVDGTYELGDLRFQLNDPLLIAGCDGATLFTVGTVNTGAGTILSNEALGQPFDNTAELYSAATIVYYIRDNPNGLRSLYRRVNQDNAGELVSGVQSMQILYGEDTGALDNVADRYLDAEDAPNMNNVVSIRIGLLMVTPDSVRREADGPATYTVLDQAGALARDGRSLHQLVVSTITLRNRAFPAP